MAGSRSFRHHCADRSLPVVKTCGRYVTSAALSILVSAGSEAFFEVELTDAIIVTLPGANCDLVMPLSDPANHCAKARLQLPLSRSLKWQSDRGVDVLVGVRNFCDGVSRLLCSSLLSVVMYNGAMDGPKTDTIFMVVRLSARIAWLSSFCTYVLRTAIGNASQPCVHTYVCV